MSQPKKKFKALMVDCDGTLVPNKIDGLPSSKVTAAINKIKGLIHVGIATSRPLFLVKSIIKHLDLRGPSIISGGAQIIDCSNLDILKEQQIEKKDLKEIAEAISKFNLNYLALTDGKDQKMKPGMVPNEAIDIALENLDPDIAEKLRSELSNISGISIHKVNSWEEGKNNLVITHVLSTKHHGILEVARILNIDTSEIIGVGDGYNDFPLLMACGLKVAMGNAAPELKEIADYIAPSVENDGVADVINKFIL